MFVTFAESFYKKLVENEFHSISKIPINDELTEDTKIVMLVKQIGPILYIVNTVNINKMGLYFYEQHIKEYKNRLLDDFEKLDSGHIVMVNILVATNMADELSLYIDKEQFISDDIFHIVPWVIDLDKNKLIVPHKHTDKILNIHQLINSALTENTTVNTDKISLHKLEEEVIRETALKHKTPNIYFTYALSIINILIWCFMCFMFFSVDNINISELLIKFGANSPQHIFNEGQYWRLFTSMFIHISTTHLMYNCFALYLFGSRVERYFGKKIFLGVYILSGLAGSISSILFTQGISVGASGGIYGLIGAIFALAQQRGKKIDGISFYLITIITITGLAFGFLDAQIDNFAHIGGLLTGYIIGFILCPEE